MRSVTLKFAHLNMLLTTNHLIHGDNEIVSIAQVMVEMQDENGNDVNLPMYDVRYINGERARLDPDTTRVEVLRK